jgi:hypothetical protein
LYIVDNLRAPDGRRQGAPALATLYRGEVDAKAAHDQAVAGIEEIVNTYLAG